MANSGFNKKKNLPQQTGLKLKDETTKCYILSIAYYGAETRNLWRIDQKYMESFEVRCCGLAEKISRTDAVKNVFRRVKEEEKILHTLKCIRQANCTGHTFRRNYLLNTY
jgi:hypothetical protein